MIKILIGKSEVIVQIFYLAVILRYNCQLHPRDVCKAHNVLLFARWQH